LVIVDNTSFNICIDMLDTLCSHDILVFRMPGVKDVDQQKFVVALAAFFKK